MDRYTLGAAAGATAAGNAGTGTIFATMAAVDAAGAVDATGSVCAAGAVLPEAC